jgi:hypothetical protein
MVWILLTILFYLISVFKYWKSTRMLVFLKGITTGWSHTFFMFVPIANTIIWLENIYDIRKLTSERKPFHKILFHGPFDKEEKDV